MKLLSTGLGWNELQPGGLNRYFADYNAAMKEYGHAELGLVVTESGDRLSTELNIVEAASSQTPLITRMRSLRRKTRQSVEAFQPEVFNPHFAPYAAMVSRSVLPQHVPIVTHFHGPWALESKVEEHHRSPLMRESRYWMKKQVELMTYRRSDSFIVLSEYFRDILTEQYGIEDRRIHIIPGAVEHEKFKPHPDRESLRRKLDIQPEQQLLFCARRIVRRMGIDRLIESMTAVVALHPGVRLFIAGDGAMREEYSRLVESLQLSDHVKLLGRVSNEELVEWYQAADMSIVPTITLEGFGLVTVESLSCGTPVLGTPYGGTKEILSRLSTDLLFEDGTSGAMSDTITAALEQSLRIPSREQCREHVLQHYTWDRVADAVTQVFEVELEKRKRFR
ncbi:glycosyltransferase family 4 protein [Paenibacillus gorillae]|uniref:glycosyltransferase family 4 protein n=1 Tax=Paenibacillus gorillae TaxID=1243662 RepID=UPI0004AF54DD|nr:glycosyltransferase family 4 protein [Paenibacillus gorillae]